MIAIKQMVAIKNETVVTKLSLGVSIAAFCAFVLSLTEQFGTRGVSPRIAAEDAVFIVTVALLLCGNLVYQLARLGYLRRQSIHIPVPYPVLETVYDGHAPRLAILIPSYREEPRVLRQTVLSAALVEYPERRVAVLIDDPPDATGENRLALEAARRLVVELDEAFAARARDLQREHWRFLARAQAGSADMQAEALHVARLYEQVAAWIEAWGDDFDASSGSGFAHTDRHFVDNVLGMPAAQHRDRAARLRSTRPHQDQIEGEYRRLGALLHVEISSFERKRYVNLSHQPNKAMNLNSYIGLIGRNFREIDGEDGTSLLECAPEEATHAVRAADYLLTLDADSYVLSDYALRLMRIMEDDPRIAVAQTPYSAVPNAPGLIERTAGATTDVQYVIHQGFTRYDATYWVGANALLRLSALAEIQTVVEERGHRISAFIQDRTVIEDTGSTVDLIRRGWKLFNYPERLAYSATPPDFGALIIQRRRWSNGGLIILGDLIRHLRENREAGTPQGLIGALMRCYYLCSPAVGSLGLLAILLYPWNDGLTSAWLPLSAAPYYFLYGRDLRFAGYRWRDLIRVYALNLILLPVNLAGVLRSLEQAATGRKAAFGRTPKIENRTASPPIHILFQWAVLFYLLVSVMVDFEVMRYANALFSLANAAVYVYAITHFLGWRESWLDVAEGLTNRWPILTRLRPNLVRGAAPARPQSLSAPAFIDTANAALERPEIEERDEKRSASAKR